MFTDHKKSVCSGRKVTFAYLYLTLLLFQLLQVFFSDGVLHLVLEFCPYDLEKVIRDKKIALKSEDVKCYLQMILKGIEACHSHYILHRGMSLH